MASQSTSKVHIDIDHIGTGIGKQTGNLKDGDDEKKCEIKYYEKEEKSDYEDLCVICFDKWAKKGGHMATRLTCGHIFGFCCINRWVKMARNCPLCKSINYKHQMRGVYQSLGTYYDSTPTSVAEHSRDENRWNARCRRRAARARRYREARRAREQRLREDAALRSTQPGETSTENAPGSTSEATRSQHS